MNRLCIFLCVLTLLACKSSPTTDEEKNEYIKFENTLKNDVSVLLEFSTTVLYKKWENQQLVDSNFIDTTQFLHIIDQFWMEEMQDENFAKLFTEVPVFDENTKQLQFHYFAKNANSNLSEVKVVTTPNQNNEHIITTVLFEISTATERKKVMWKIKEMIQIVTVPKNNDGKVIVEELIWEPSKFFD